MPERSVRLLGVPIDSVGGRVGTAFMPSTLRSAGLVGAIQAEDAGDLDVVIEPAIRDAATGIIGSASVLDVTRTVADAVAGLIEPEGSLVILGGCCTLAVGAIAGVRRSVGDIGVVYIDGHLDLYDGRTSPTGEAADMPLATALGLGPEAWVEAAGGPQLRPDDVVLLGFRDLAEARGFGSLTPRDLPGIDARDADRDPIRRLRSDRHRGGRVGVSRAALLRLRRSRRARRGRVPQRCPRARWSRLARARAPAGAPGDPSRVPGSLDRLLQPRARPGGAQRASHRGAARRACSSPPNRRRRRSRRGPACRPAPPRGSPTARRPRRRGRPPRPDHGPPRVRRRGPH